MTEENKSELGNAMANAKAPEDKQEPEVELPDRWKDKSPAEIVKAHEELERKLGEQGREFGEYKKALEQAQSELAYSRQAPPPQAPQPVQPENLDNEFFTNPTETMKKFVQKEIQDSRAQDRYEYGSRAFSGTLEQLKQSDPDVFGDDEIIGLTRQFVDHGLKSRQLDPMIQADPNLLRHIGVGLKYERDKKNPNRTPVQPVATETPAAVKTNEPVAKTIQHSPKAQAFIDYFSDVEGSGIESEKDAAELLEEESEK